MAMPKFVIEREIPGAGIDAGGTYLAVVIRAACLTGEAL
jgi:hypothetical protein